jgi:hypothetical protein
MLGVLGIAIVVADIRPMASAAPSAGWMDRQTAARQSAWIEYSSSRNAVRRARERLGAAELTLFRFMFTGVDEPVESAPTQSAIPAHRPARMDDNANPISADVEQRLANLNREREKLLDRLTPSHPTMQALDASIADLERRIEGARKTTQTPLPPIELNLPTAERPERAGVANEPRGSVVSFEKLKDLMIFAGHARRDFEIAADSERVKWADFSHAVSAVALAPAVPMTRSVDPPQPVFAIYLVLIVATVGGIAAATAAQGSKPTFDAANEVESELNLPILGTLMIAGGSNDGPALATTEVQFWIRRSMAVAELTLAIAIGALVVLALSDFPLARHLAADPFSGLVDGIVKLRGLVGK